MITSCSILSRTAELREACCRTSSKKYDLVATAQSGHTAAELERAIDQELAHLDVSPPTATEVEQARAFVQTKALHDIEPPVQLVGALNLFEAPLTDCGTQVTTAFRGAYAHFAV